MTPWNGKIILDGNFFLYWSNPTYNFHSYEVIFNSAIARVIKIGVFLLLTLNFENLRYSTALAHHAVLKIKLFRGRIYHYYVEVEQPIHGCVYLILLIEFSAVIFIHIGLQTTMIEKINFEKSLFTY